MSRRQVKNLTIVHKNINILDFGDYIWNKHEKCSQISINMPVLLGIGLDICEMLIILRNKTRLYGRVQSIKQGFVTRMLSLLQLRNVITLHIFRLAYLMESFNNFSIGK